MNESPAAQNSGAVPDWGRKSGSDLGTVLTLALVCAMLAYGVWLLPVLVDWGSSERGEGLLSLAASRIRAGEWPYRDFHFPGTPGAPFLHALLQGAGAGWPIERAASLMASLGSTWLVISFARFLRMPFTELAILGGLLATWSFPLLNIADSAWYAVFLALLAIRALPRSRVMSAVLFALAFGFQPMVGAFGALGAGILLSRGRRRGLLALGILLSVLSLYEFLQFWPARELPPGESFGAPLTLLGLWMLSLFFLRSDRNSRSARMVQLGVLAYGAIYASRDLDSFIRSSFILLSIIAWPVSLALALTEKSRDPRFFLFLTPAFGLFLGALPGFGFRHFLFVFPLTALLLAYSLARVRARYSWLPPLWARLPAIALLAGGVFLQSGLVSLRAEGVRDSLGRVSQGANQRLDEEVTAVWRFLAGEGLKPGDPILVLPDAPGVYLWAGFRDPTPFLRAPSSGSGQNELFARFRAAGGRFLVVEERSGIETTGPEIWREIQANYREVKSFPEHFTVYAPR